MDMTRLKKLVAGLSMSALLLTQAGIVSAYSDVPSGVWYESAVNAFVGAGYLDGSQDRFRGGDAALRAEFIKLVVELNGGILGTPPAIPTFDDVTPNAWFFGYFEDAAAEGWVSGDNNCAATGARPCFARPGDKINRAEAAKILVNAFGLVGTGLAPQFTDNPSGQWYTDAIQIAADNCVLQGDGGTGRVRPGDNMNRAEMVVMLGRIDEGRQYPDCGNDNGSNPAPVSGPAGIDTATPINASTLEVEFNTAIDRTTAEDVANYDIDGLTIISAQVTGTDTVELTFDNSMSPGDSYTLFVAGMTSGGEDFDDSISFLGFRDVPISEGTLELSLNPNTPLGDTVPRGAVGIAMLSVDFTGSCSDDILIDGLTVIHEGQGSEADITNAWMSVNGGRVSRTRVFDSEDQTADLRFSRPLLIEACETVTVDFMADFVSTASINGRHNYVVELASDIDSNAKAVVGNFPIRGETFEVAAVAAGIVTVTYRTVNPGQIDVNDPKAVVGKWEFSVDSTEDQTFYSITLENSGTASDGDFTNIFVRRTDGTALTDTVSQTVADYVTLTFDPPFTVLEGDKVTLEAVADIVDGAGDTVQMQFEETNDVFAVGSLYGYGVNGQLYGSQIAIAATPAVSAVTINAGELTIDIDGPVTEEYTPDADDVVMANIDFVTGGEDLNVNEMFALIVGQTSTGGNLACGPPTSVGDSIAEVVEDVEIRNNVTGQTVDGVLLASDAGTSTPTTCNNTAPTTAVYRFDDFVLRDTSRWELRLDFRENTGTSGQHPRNGDSFRVFVCTADENDTVGCDFGGNVGASTAYNFDAEGLSTGDLVTDIRPGEDISGNFQTVAVASLSITERSLGTSDTVVENSSDVNFFRFEATAGKAEDIFLTQVVVKSDTGTLVDGQQYALWVDSDDDGTVDTILEGGQGEKDSQITFDDLVGGGYTIPAEETVMFEVHADIAGSLSRDELSLGFDDNNGAATNFNFIDAEEADDGTSLVCIQVITSGVAANSTSCGTNSPQIIVSTATSKIFNLKNQGSLFVTRDNSPTRSRQLLAGELGEAILRLELRAEDEAIDVTRLIFTNSGSTYVDENINRYQLYRDDETTPFASATKDNCNNISTSIPDSSFCAVMESQQLVVADGDRTDVLVRPLLKSDEEGATQTNTGSIRLVVHRVTDDSGSGGLVNDTTGTGSVTARGFESSNVLFRNNTDAVQNGEVFIGTDTATGDFIIVGNRNDVVLAKIVSVEDVNEADDGDDILQGSNRVIGKFQFKSATNNNTLGGRNQATLSGVIFTISSSNVEFATSGFELYNEKDSTERIACTASGSRVGGVTTSGTFLIDCKRSTNTAVDLEMDSGDSITLVVQADINNNRISSTAGSSLVVIFDSFSERTRTRYGTYGTGSHIQWSDSLNDSASVFFTWIEFNQTQVSSTSYDLQ